MKKAAEQSHEPNPCGFGRPPRCLAKTRRGTECQCPAMRGRKRCRIHGGANPGAPVGNRNAYRHGMRSAKMIAMRDELRALIAAAQDTIDSLDD